jgi:hypothetical protein
MAMVMMAMLFIVEERQTHQTEVPLLSLHGGEVLSLDPESGGDYDIYLLTYIYLYYM